MSFFKAGNLVESTASVVTSGGTTVLTAASLTYQDFTGTATEDVVLPDATTIDNGQKYIFRNSSTQTIYIYNDGLNLLATVVPNSERLFHLKDNASADGSWYVSQDTQDAINKAAYYYAVVL